MIPVPIGPVVIPVQILHEVRAIVDLSISGSLSGGGFVATAAGQTSLTAGAEYSDGTWSRVWEPTASSSLTTEVTRPGTMTATLEGKLTIEYTYTGKLYGLIGPRVALIAQATGTFEMDPEACKWTAQGKVTFSAEAGLSTTACSGGHPTHPDPVEEEFNKRFAELTGKERETALDWYTRGHCAPVISLGRFPALQETGLACLTVVPGSDWTEKVNRAWVYGSIDHGGSFVMATDPRHVRAHFGNTGVPAPPASNNYRTVSLCDRRSITADGIDTLNAEGYRMIYLTPAPRPEGPCTSVGGTSAPCTYGPVKLLTRVAPPRGNFITFLASASVTFPLFETPPITTSGPLDPEGVVFEQCEGRDECGEAQRPNIFALGYVRQADGNCLPDCDQDGQSRAPDGSCVFIGTNANCSAPGDACTGGKICRGQSQGVTACVCPDGMVWDLGSNQCTSDVSRGCLYTELNSGYSQCGTVDHPCVYLTGEDNCGACGNRCTGGRERMGAGDTYACGCPADRPNFDPARTRCVSGEPSDRSVHPTCPDGYSLIAGNRCPHSRLRCGDCGWFDPTSATSCGSCNDECRASKECLTATSRTGHVALCGCRQGTTITTPPYQPDGNCTD